MDKQSAIPSSQPPRLYSYPPTTIYRKRDAALPQQWQQHVRRLPTSVPIPSAPKGGPTSSTSAHGLQGQTRSPRWDPCRSIRFVALVITTAGVRAPAPWLSLSCPLSTIIGDRDGQSFFLTHQSPTIVVPFQQLPSDPACGVGNIPG